MGLVYPNIIPTPVWGFKSTNTDFYLCSKRCVKFIIPINISQISVYKQIGRFVYKYLFTHIHYIHIHVKNYIFNDKIYFYYINILFPFNTRIFYYSIIPQHNQFSPHINQTNKPSMVCGWRVSGAAKHRLHPSIYI